MKNEHLFDLIADQYALGAVLAPPKAVAGGRLHQLYRLSTSSGVFAVKCINPAMVQVDSLFVARLEESACFAAECAQAGISAVVARYSGQKRVVAFEDSYIMVYDWIEGRVCATSRLNRRHAAQIGQTLAQIHKCRFLSSKTLLMPRRYRLTDLDWSVLRSNLAAKHPSIHAVLSQNESEIEAIHKISMQLPPRQLSECVLSHRDLDRYNVLWKEDKAYLLDWDLSGPVAPLTELMSGMLDWGVAGAGKADFECVRAVAKGYINAGGQLDGDIERAFNEVLSVWLDWLNSLLQRLSDLSPEDVQYYQLIEQTTFTMEMLSFVRGSVKSSLLKFFSAL